METELACLIVIDDTCCDPEPVPHEQTEPEESVEEREPKLAFSHCFLEFGILPTGINVQKDLFVFSMSDEPVKWKIVEIKYNADSVPYMEILEEANVTCSRGHFSYKLQKQKISYSIIDKEPISWVSILLLVSLDDEFNIETEAICIITYEIIQFDITLNTGHTKGPILCPLKLMYVRVPITLNFFVENHSPITGCFCFSKPYGDDVDKIDIELGPRSEELKPLESKEVTVKLTCKDVGVFENVFVSCFISEAQDPIVLRILCAVDGFHAYFYVPARDGFYRKIMWPPKIVYEYDEDWMICPCTMEYGQELEFSLSSNRTSSKNDGDTKTLSTMSNGESNVKAESLQYKFNMENRSGEFVGEEMTEIGTKESRQSSNVTSSSESSLKKDLMDILEEQFGGELFLQEHFSEMHKVPIRTPTKLTFYFENVTPVKTTYTVEATNFSTNKRFDRRALNLKLKKEDDIWNEMILNDYGILVQPDVESGDVSDSELINVNLLVYVTTWGIYAEEIVVDIPDVPCFTFSLLIEVVGTPITFPMALNSITEYPTVRFGKVSYCSEHVKRSIKITNTSCVPLNILWHTFLTTSEDEDKLRFNVTFEVVDKKYYQNESRLLLLDKYYGKETTDVFEIVPEETDIDAYSSTFVDVVIKPDSFPADEEEKNLRGFLVGHIFLEERYRNKVNYFHRSTEPEESRVKIEIIATLELPVLTMDPICEESQIFVYANDIAFNKDWENSITLVFQNNNMSAAKGHMEIAEPFEIKKINGKRTKGVVTYTVEPMDCMQVHICCNLNYQKILELSELVYTEDKISGKLAKKLNSIRYCVCKETNFIHVQKRLKIFQNRAPVQIFPVELYVYYPHIVVEPSSIKFECVLIGSTRKTLISVYNLTGCLVKFEIYKSLATDEIFVTPHYGEIAKTTGANKEFTHIFIYFTPRECKQYQESIRIVTNIPNYYIEIPIRGCGSFNEKFYVDYKI